LFDGDDFADAQAGVNAERKKQLIASVGKDL
jgi:hypothetical protein